MLSPDAGQARQDTGSVRRDTKCRACSASRTASRAGPAPQPSRYTHLEVREAELLDVLWHAGDEGPGQREVLLCDSRQGWGQGHGVRW